MNYYLSFFLDDAFEFWQFVFSIGKDNGRGKKGVLAHARAINVYTSEYIERISRLYNHQTEKWFTANADRVDWREYEPKCFSLFSDSFKEQFKSRVQLGSYFIFNYL